MYRQKLKQLLPPLHCPFPKTLAPPGFPLLDLPGHLLRTPVSLCRSGLHPRLCIGIPWGNVLGTLMPRPPQKTNSESQRGRARPRWFLKLLGDCNMKLNLRKGSNPHYSEWNPGTSNLNRPETLLGMQTSRPHPGPTESESSTF